MRKVSDWCRSHPWFTSLAGLVAFCVVLHYFFNWRAEQRWQRYCTDARARGVKLTLPEFARPEIPDEQNFAALPMLRAAIDGSGKPPFELPAHVAFTSLFGDKVKRERTDWATLQKDFQRAGFIADISSDPVRDTLQGLDHYAPQFREWSEWRTRPQCRFAVDFKKPATMSVAHLGTLQDAARVFGLRMRAHLALHDSAAAYADFQEAFQAYLALREEPMFINSLVRISILGGLIPAVGTGLMDRAWTADDLRKIEADLASVHVWADYRLAVAGERSYVNSLLDPLARASVFARWQTIANLSNPGTRSGSARLFLLVPRRVVRDNQLRENLYFDEMLARVDATAEHFDPDGDMPSAPERLTDKFAQYYYFLCRTPSLAFTGSERRHLVLQTRLDLLHLACILERFRQARGDFPAALEDLKPDFIADLPMDPYARSPYHYERTEQGSFRLYSVGPDHRDDGGVPDVDKSEDRQLDAIWFYAPSAPSP